MQWDVVSGTLTMSVVLLSSDDNAITKRRGKKIKARQGTGSAPTRTLLAPCEGCRSVLLLNCNFCTSMKMCMHLIYSTALGSN